MVGSNIKYIKNCTDNEANKKRLSAKTSAISKTISRVIFYVLCVSFIGVSAYVLFFSPYLQIASITISGTQELKSQDIRQLIEMSAQGEFFGLVPKNNFLFFPQKRIENLLKDNFKKIRSVTVTKKFPDSILININERKAVMVWCSGEKCFLIDENGTAYNNADFDSPEIVQNNLIRINDSSGRVFGVGEKITSPSYEQYILGIKEALKNVGFEISNDANGAYRTPSNMADELDVKTEQEIDFYFSTQFPLESAIRTLDIALKKGIKEKEKEFEYIDLRSENKIFYKFKNQDLEEENEAGETQPEK